jgi:hypothetical protein
MKQHFPLPEPNTRDVVDIDRHIARRVKTHVAAQAPIVQRQLQKALRNPALRL